MRLAHYRTCRDTHLQTQPHQKVQNLTVKISEEKKTLPVVCQAVTVPMTTTAKMTQEERQQLKRQAVEYFDTNDVPVRLEALLNKMFFERPADIYGYTVSSAQLHRHG